MPRKKKAPDSKPAQADPGPEYFNVANLDELSPEQRKEVLRRIVDTINARRHPPDGQAPLDKKDQPPE